MTIIPVMDLQLESYLIPVKNTYVCVRYIKTNMVITTALQLNCLVTRIRKWPRLYVN